jgi:hypothetical protein
MRAFEINETFFRRHGIVGSIHGCRPKDSMRLRKASLDPTGHRTSQ